MSYENGSKTWRPLSFSELEGALGVQRLNGEIAYDIDMVLKESPQSWVEVKYGYMELGVFPPSDSVPRPVTITINVDNAGKVVSLGFKKRKK